MAFMNARNILLVEDDPRDVTLTLETLKEQDLARNVYVVHDGGEALDFLFRRGKFIMRTGGNPVVVLLDNKLPKVNGLEVLKAIKGDEHLKSIPVVALTSSRERPDLQEFYKHGVNAYVVKPVSFAEFARAIGQLGVFWGAINEPPPNSGLEAPSNEGGQSEKSDPGPALGG